MVPISRFDLILLFIFGLIVAVVAADAWLIVNGFEQFTSGFWTFATAVCAGEIATFSVYRISKARAPKWLRAKHQAIADLEDEDEQGTGN